MFEKCPYFTLNAVARELSRVWDQEFKPTGLSASQAYLVMLIVNKPGLAQKEVANIMNLERSTVARLLESLEQKGFIRREDDDGDARSSRVFASARGIRLSPELETISQSLMKKLQKKVPLEKVQNLVSRTNQVIGDLRG